MVTSADRDVIASEFSDLLPVFKYALVSRRPVHIGTQRMSAAAVTVKAHSRDSRSVGFVAVEYLYRARQELERRALIDEVTAREVGVVRRNIGESVEARLIVDCVGVSLINAVNAARSGNA